MGATISRADAEGGGASAPPPIPNFSASPVMQQAIDDLKAAANRVNYMNLPQPVKYEEISREVMMALRPELFEGMRFEITRPLNQNFFLTHSMFMGNIEMPSQGQRQLKLPVGTYEFGANLISEKHYAFGRITTDGRLTGRLKYDLADWLSLKGHMQFTGEEGPGSSQLMVDADIKGKDWNSQVKLGNPGFYGLNYIQSVTPALSLGGEFFFLSQQLKSGMGVALRHATDQHVAVMQAATTGILSLQYAHRVTDKITIASDLLWHWNQREATAQVGYDCMLRQCRLRGKIDTNGVVSCLVEEAFAPGIRFLLSAEVDHPGKNYKFGFGFNVGE